MSEETPQEPGIPVSAVINYIKDLQGQLEMINTNLKSNVLHLTNLVNGEETEGDTPNVNNQG